MITLEWLVLTIGVVVALLIVGVIVNKLVGAFFDEKGDPSVQSLERMMREISALAELGPGAEIPDLGFGSQVRLVVQGFRSELRVGNCPPGAACLCVFYRPELGADTIHCEEFPKAGTGVFGEKAGFVPRAGCPATCGGGVMCVDDGVVSLDVPANHPVVLSRNCNVLEVRLG